MLTKGDKLAFSGIALLCILMFVFWNDVKKIAGGKEKTVSVSASQNKGEPKKNKQIDKTKQELPLAIEQKWELPSDLKEVSGIAVINNDRIVCIQDENGILFIFNTATGKVEKKIPFAGTGDYEGVALVQTSAYVVRSDGKLFEVSDYNGAKPKTFQHSTPLTEKQNVEGLCYDQKNNRLLLAIKGKEENSKDYKGIYAFDLATKKAANEPVYKIGLGHEILKEVKGKQKIQPSDLAVHPVSGDLYIIDGADPKLLILGADGTHKKVYPLRNAAFSQPEGIAFSESGDLYISNEGKKEPGNILKVSLPGNP